MGQKRTFFRILKGIKRAVMYYFSDDEDDQPESIEDRLWHIKSCLSTTIDLSLLDLTTFPDEVFDYPQVTVLRIGTVPSLPNDLVQRMTDNLLKQSATDENSADAVRDLTDQLAVIQDMAEFKTIGRLPDRISELTNLVELDLQGQQLTELPESLCYLPNLKRLYLPDNQLTTLPAHFSRLRSLVCLEVRDNPIQRWPAGFWQMPFIEKYRNRLLEADAREYELYMQKDYKAAYEVRKEALRWGLHL